ncbi:hypothetical protein DD237_004600 [Peronospora effusa]|uniref:Myb-like domain-containing protein n=1 Tax=Peronospora effusa TaxID=542832 RepID=A0A3R7XXF6_9STRA|nr:hypothetical protein DD237_004600 [Peronospora effusa]
MQQHLDNGYSHDGSSCDRSDWRREEHGRFMQALELYGSRQTGDEWKHITDFVGSRSMEEVRLHGRQYLQRLVQQLPPSPMVAPSNGYLLHAGSQNDSNRQKYQVQQGIDSHKSRDDKGKRVVPQPGALVSAGSALSAAAADCALSMNVLAPVRFRSQPRQLLQQENQTVIAAPHRNGRWSNTWTFQEEKAFETTLVGWAGSKSYPWTQIAAAVPGRTAKEVCNRFDEMVGEIASIEAGEIPDLESSTSSSIPNNSVAVRQQGRSSLSRRAVPPPPIEILRLDGAAGVFLSGTSTRSRRGSVSGIPMLSPTFLDMLAKEAESEEKSSLPALPLQFPELTSLPSPMFSSTLLPAVSPTSFFSPGENKSAARGKKLSNADSSDDIKMEDMDASTTVTRESEDPRRSSTPRIMNDFLAGDFKFDDPLGTTPIHRRKSPRFMKSTIFGGQESLTIKAESGADKQDIEMTDASAA